jgi:hypothetical protein
MVRTEQWFGSLMEYSIKANVASVPCYYTQAYCLNFLTILATALQWIIADHKHVAKIWRKGVRVRVCVGGACARTRHVQNTGMFCLFLKSYEFKVHG